MTPDPIRVGVIGCGEIAQLMHLPFLEELPDFSVTAVCDLSPTLVARMQERYRVPAAYRDAAELIADPRVDAVVLCTNDHAGPAVAALHAGKHLLVEKPVAFTPEEGDRVAEAATASSAVGMVGYMKLYDPGFVRAQEILADIGPARGRTVQDLAGRFDRYGDLYRLARASDVDPEVLAAGRAAVDARVRDHLGSQAGWGDLYLLILGLASHDLAVMRAAFGAPSGVTFAQASDSRGVLAVLDYPDGVPCVFRIGIGTGYEWWDEWLAVDTDVAGIRVDFGHPYVKFDPTVVTTRDSRPGRDCRGTETVSRVSPFRIELEHFARAIRGEDAVRTPIAGGVEDLRVASEIIAALGSAGPAEDRR
jgi:predicted dehydrogenase